VTNCVCDFFCLLSRMKSSTLGFILVLALGVALGAVGAQWLAARNAAAPGTPVQASSPAAPVEKKVVVEVAPVEQVALPRGVSAVGSLRSENSVMLRPEITGRIAEINFNEGGKVTKGQVLVRLDDSVVKAQLQQ